jgi:hypothetical protein
MTGQPGGQPPQQPPPQQPPPQQPRLPQGWAPQPGQTYPGPATRGLGAAGSTRSALRRAAAGWIVQPSWGVPSTQKPDNNTVIVVLVVVVLLAFVVLPIVIFFGGSSSSRLRRHPEPDRGPISRQARRTTRMEFSLLEWVAEHQEELALDAAGRPRSLLWLQSQRQARNACGDGPMDLVFALVFLAGRWSVGPRRGPTIRG